MEITFRFNAENEIQITAEPSRIWLRRYKLPSNIPLIEVPRDPRVESSKDLEEAEFKVRLSRGEARSIASALMQAAAEA